MVVRIFGLSVVVTIVSLIIAFLYGGVEALIERVLPNREVLAHLRASKSPKPGSRIRFAGAFDAEVLGRAGPDGALFHLRFPDEPLALLLRAVLDDRQRAGADVDAVSSQIFEPSAEKLQKLEAAARAVGKKCPVRGFHLHGVDLPRMM